MNTTLESAAPSAAKIVRSYQFGGCELEMEVNDTVFQPTLTSRLLAQAVQIPEGARVLDLGCGAGVLAVVAALKGASYVRAVDVMPESRLLVEANARRNHVEDRIEASCSDLFENLGTQQYDVIVSDVSRSRG